MRREERRGEARAGVGGVGGERAGRGVMYGVG